MLDAIANIVGGLIGSDNVDKTNAMTRDLSLQNFAMQERFAKEGIRWKVEDAKAAGIHPLYALGASTPSFSPVSANFQADTSLPNAIAKTGQDLTSSIDKTRTAEEKQSAFNRTMQALTLEKAGLENDVLRTQIASTTARLKQTASPPMPTSGDPYLIPGQGNSGLVNAKPLEVAPSPSNAPHNEASSVSDLGYARTKTGWAPVPSKDVKDRIEDNLVPEMSWALRNHVLPTIGLNQLPPPFDPPKGHRWFFEPLLQEYQLKPYKKRLQLNNPFRNPN